MAHLSDNVFEPYRERILYPIAVVLPIVFMPLALHHFLFGDTALATTLLTAMVMLAVDALALSCGRSPPFPFPLLLIPGVAATGISIVTLGVYGVLWSFPVMLFTYFVLPRGRANATCVSMGGMATALVYLHIDAGTALRFALSISLCLVVVNLILGVVESLQSRLMELTVTDPLTGAFNRRRMDETLAQLIERRARTGATASAILVDVDHFKSINDRFGHEAGDRVLKGLVTRLKDRARKLDSVFRVGGEEFLVLLPDTGAAEAVGVAESLRQAVANAVLLDDEPVTISVGVSELRERDGADDWLKRADEALYRAKKSGRDRVLGTGSYEAPGSVALKPRAPALWSVS